MSREFKGVWIPAEVWLDPRLTLVEKALLAEIDSFTGNEKFFYKSNETIKQEYQVSRPTITRALKKLSDLDMITVHFDGRVRRIFAHAACSKVSNRWKDLNTLPDQNDHPACSNVASTNTIENTEENTETKGVVLPFDSDTFAKAWDVWKQDRKDRKIKTYTARGEQAALHKLQNDSQQDEATAIQIIHQSIANGWQGLFPLKNTHNAKHKSRGPSDGSLLRAHLKRLANDSTEGME